ncbi:CGNR zinc finger domain-containing protein [Polymorphospora lycopeni]|uniref:CGNR zinc finger domain-containing protein n=1 Tax=Polymorphospora lycopeni TaxID=3140240 RepID=A0ABV5CVM4_9ACTN
MTQPGDRAPAPGALTLVQDFANTADLAGGRDGLGGPDDLTALCAAHGLTDVWFDETDIAEARRLREALRDVCEAHTGVEIPAASLAVLDAMLDGAPLVLSVDAGGQARALPRPGLTGLSALTAALAARILAAAADRTWPRLKACGAHDCRWVYYDHSPAGRSRWCTMSICGSRAKMRAYRGRSRPVNASVVPTRR